MGLEPTPICPKKSQRIEQIPCAGGAESGAVAARPSLPVVPDGPPSPVVTALLELAKQLTAPDRATLTHLLLAEMSGSGDGS